MIDIQSRISPINGYKSIYTTSAVRVVAKIAKKNRSTIADDDDMS